MSQHTEEIITADITVCCNCHKWFVHAREFARHATTQSCANAKSVTKQVSMTVDIPGLPNSPPVKPFSPEHVLRGTMPMFADDIDDRTTDCVLINRIQHLFEGSIESLLEPCEDPNARPGLWLVEVYGAHAPKTFQSLVCHKSQVHYTTYSDDSNWLEFQTVPLTAKFKRRVLVEVLELMKIVCEVSVPAQRPDLVMRAKEVLEWMNAPREKGVSLYESYTDRDKYVSARTNMCILPILRHNLEEAFGNAFDLTFSVSAT